MSKKSINLLICPRHKLLGLSYYTSIPGARVRVIGWGTMLQAARLLDLFLIRSSDFSIDLILPLQPHYGHGVDSASNRNEYQESSWGEVRQAPKADNLTTICKPSVWKMWEPRRLTTLWASTACYRYSFTLPLFYYH
jgi:hypothetical protein